MKDASDTIIFDVNPGDIVIDNMQPEFIGIVFDEGKGDVRVRWLYPETWRGCFTRPYLRQLRVLSLDEIIMLALSGKQLDHDNS